MTRPPAVDLEANDLLLFARVVAAGSLSRAAERLGMPKSTVSRRISALERQLGERLLLRTTRKMTVTDFGLAVLDHAREVVAGVDATTSLAQNRQAEPSGRLRVSMPGDLANLLLAPFLSEFVLAYPAIILELDLSARFVDLIGENVDVAVRMGDLRSDASLAARRVAVFTTALYAAPAYLARRGTPATPDDLLQHDGLYVPSRTGERMPWILHWGEQRWQGSPPARAVANSPEVLMRMALQGVGITFVHEHFAAPYVEAARLVPVLPAWHLPPVSAWAVFAGRRLMPTRTRVFIDALVAKFSGPECAAVRAHARKRTAKRASARPGAQPR